MLTSHQLLDEFNQFLSGVKPARAIDPGHRIAFRWPPHAVSTDYHVLPQDWTIKTKAVLFDEEFDVEEADLPTGYFGRIFSVSVEARGDTRADMLVALKKTLRPLIERTRAISDALGRSDRFSGTLSNLSPIEILKLLYCADRDVATQARVVIETHASEGLVTPCLIRVLQDSTHPMRRSAQWCVLDIFEDLPAFARDEATMREAVKAIKAILWSAEDDYARTVYKAGVVLGGHICTDEAAQAVLECCFAPSRIGRRSAIHACFHLVEWMPKLRSTVVEHLSTVAEQDSEAVLRTFARHMAHDIASDEYDHVTEPDFPGEK